MEKRKRKTVSDSAVRDGREGTATYGECFPVELDCDEPEDEFFNEEDTPSGEQGLEMSNVSVRAF